MSVEGDDFAENAGYAVEMSVTINDKHSCFCHYSDRKSSFWSEPMTSTLRMRVTLEMLPPLGWPW